MVQQHLSIVKEKNSEALPVHMQNYHNVYIHVKNEACNYKNKFYVLINHSAGYIVKDLLLFRALIKHLAEPAHAMTKVT